MNANASTIGNLQVSTLQKLQGSSEKRRTFITSVAADGRHFTFATRGRALSVEELHELPRRWEEAHREFALPGEALFVTLGENIDRRWPDGGLPPFSIPIF